MGTGPGEMRAGLYPIPRQVGRQHHLVARPCSAACESETALARWLRDSARQRLQGVSLFSCAFTSSTARKLLRSSTHATADCSIGSKDREFRNFTWRQGNDL